MEYEKIMPEVWKPEKEGDTIEGVLISVEKEAGKFKSTVYHIETINKEHKIVFGTAVLDNRMSYIKEGESFKIVFTGMQKNEKKQDVKLFDVFKGRK